VAFGESHANSRTDCDAFWEAKPYESHIVSGNAKYNPKWDHYPNAYGDPDTNSFAFFVIVFFRHKLLS